MKPTNQQTSPPGNGTSAPRRRFWLLCLFGAGLLSLDLLPFVHEGPDWYMPPGFYGFYGFAACVLLVLAARLLRRLTMRREDYYD